MICSKPMVIFTDIATEAIVPGSERGSSSNVDDIDVDSDVVIMI